MSNVPVCRHCGAPIDHFPSIAVPCLQWKHASGFYGCNGSKPAASVTYAEPSEVAA